MSLLTNSDTWHSKLVRDIGYLLVCIFPPTKYSNMYRGAYRQALLGEVGAEHAIRQGVLIFLNVGPQDPTLLSVLWLMLSALSSTFCS
jgi:hypothetical protein